MKKLLSILLLLSIATPALPMQRAKEIIKKYGLSTTQILAGTTALGYSAYLMYKNGLFSVAASTIVISGSGFFNLSSYNEIPSSGFSYIESNGTTIKSFLGKHFITNNGSNTVTINNKIINGSGTFIVDSNGQTTTWKNIAKDSALTVGTGLLGTALLSSGISNFKKAYSRP